MRLAVVSPFVDRRHGTERAVAELLERLAGEYGCEIHLYAQRVEDLRVSDPKSAHPARSGGIIWHKVPSIPGPHVAQFLGWMFLNGFQRRWDKTFGGVSYDLVLSPGINCLHPDVVIVHALFHRLRELSREEKQEQADKAGFFRRVHRRVYYALLTGLERRIYGDAKVTLGTPSRRTAGLLREYFHREDVYLVPNGVDLEYFSAGARIARRAEARKRRGFRGEHFILLLIGNDWRIKGLPAILDAIALLSALPIRLLVVGSDAAETFRARAVQLGVQDRCLWELPRPDVLDFYAAADVYVSPTREDCFSLPVLEAMACGLPAITSIFNGVTDCIRDGVDGYVVREPRDARTLAHLIERLRADLKLRLHMGEAAAKTSLRWSWDRNAAAVWELLKVIDAKRASSES
ncbi:MAG: glycosyltransferase family 4 protein [Candidatus Acidiferrum sp.]